MKDEIIDLVVAVDQGASVPRLHSFVGEELHQLIEMRNIPNCFAGLDIYSLALRDRDCPERLYLPVVEA